MPSPSRSFKGKARVGMGLMNRCVYLSLSSSTDFPVLTLKTLFEKHEFFIRVIINPVRTLEDILEHQDEQFSP